MKVFLDEPLIDWQKNAHLQSKGMQTAASTTSSDGTQQSRRMDVARFAQLQMQVANRKLGVFATHHFALAVGHLFFADRDFA